MSGGQPALRSLRAVRTIRLATTIVLALLALGSAACVTRPVRQKVFDDGYTKVLLRSYKRGMTPVSMGYEHPAAIAQVRIAHILSRIDMRKGEDGERLPAVPLDTLFTIAEGVHEALGQATPDQEIVVQSIRRGKHLGIFDRQYLTSLLLYMKDDLLYIHLSRSEWEIPPRREDRLPETHAGEHPLDFRLVVDKGMTLAGRQAVAVSWRDPIFRKPSRTRITSTGKVVRRTVLMESLEDETDYGPTPRMTDDLDPEQLRALADLEEARRNGKLTESEYSSQRDRILRGETGAP
jgi:hypothetical protein